MKFTIVFMLVALTACAVAQETYNPKYDDFDATALAGNKRLLKAYSHCFLDKGPCTAEGSDFKRVMPEALSTNCAKCSPKQKDLIRVVVKAIQKDFPQEWQELVKKQDPEGKYTESFEKFLKEN